MELAQSLRIRRNTFSIVMDYTFARSASHKTRRRFKSSIYLFADHAFGLHRAPLPPRISFIIRSAITPFASAANIIKEVSIRAPLRRGLSRWVSPAGKPGRS